MNTMRTRGRPTLVVALAAMAVVAAACGAGTAVGDTAGGAGEPVVLHMASTGSSNSYRPPIEYFVQRIGEVSNGALRIEMDFNWGNYAADAEQQAIRDVVGGKVDLTSVGTRVFDTLNDSSFRAIQAPMLIDSYAVQAAVIRSDIPDRMLAGLDTLGVSGVAMIGGAMWKPMAAKKPLLGPADWRGITFQSYRSNDIRAAIEALGAVPTDTLGGLDAGLDDGSIQGFAKGLRAYQINGTEHRAPYVTANVNLWADTAVIVANPARLARLTDAQRGWLREAANDAATRSADVGNDEGEIVTAVCDAGSHLVNASETDLAALRKAFAPVYVDLERDPQTKAFSDQIRALKQSTTPEPALAIPAGCTAPGAAPSILPPTIDALAGTWTTAKLTESEVVRAFVAAGGDEKEGHAFFAQLGGGAKQYAVISIALQDGVFKEYESGDGGPPVNGYEGRYSQVNDGTLNVDSGSCTGTYGYELSGDTLVLRVLNQCSSHDGPYNSTLFASFPFTRSGAGATNDPLAGTWSTAQLTESQVVRAYVAAGGAEKDGHEVFGARQFLVVTLKFDNGLFVETQSRDGGVPEVGNTGTYTVENGRFLLHAGSCTETFGYKVTGDVLQLRYLNPICPNDGHPIGQTLYTGFPFTRST
jgi:TRAP-type C4-dicarboxylate transport system substrate-binding protein